MRKTIAMLTLLAVSLTFYGCRSGSNETGDSTDTAGATSESTDQDADAGHHHDHGELGPHGGHILHLEPSGLHAEWTHEDEEHLITVHLDDFADSDVQEVKFLVDIPNGESEEFMAEQRDQGWVVTSESLMTHINMGDAVGVNLIVVDEDGEHTATIEEHDHDHGHAH